MIKIIGLTGGIASGKSVVSEWLRSHRIPVLDADVASREVVEPGAPVLGELVQSFGNQILTATGRLDRVRLGEIVFSSEHARGHLNRIMHPAILEWFHTQTSRYRECGASLLVWDVPLLIDLGWQRYVDEVWVIKALPEQQIARLQKRDGYTEAEAKARLDAQITMVEREAVADVILDNTGSIEGLYAQLELLLESVQVRV